MKRIEITIAPNGTTKVATKGFLGDECRQADAFLRRSLGVELREERTAEWFASTTQEQTVTRH
jgi:hypothetical protein